MLKLFDELFILSLHEEKCSVLASIEDRYMFGIAAAILTELALAGKLRMDEKRRLELTDATPTGDAILDEALQHLSKAERLRKLSYWIGSVMDKPKKLREGLEERLVSMGVLHQDDRRPWWVVPSPFHPEINASTKYALKHHLRTVVLTCQEAGQKEIALLSTMSGCRMLEVVFLKDEFKIARRRIHELLLGEALSNPNFQIVEEIQSNLESICEDD